MELSKQINTDLIEAMKAKNETNVSVLRMLKSQLKNKEIEIGKPLTEEDILNVIIKQVKQRQDSISEFKSGNRADLVEKEQIEINILNKYLPEPLTEEEIIKIINETITDTGANTMSDIGKVMPQVLAKLKGRADNAHVSKLVREKLSNK